MKLLKKGLETLVFQKKLIPIVLFLLIFSSMAFAENIETEMAAINADLEGQEIPSPLDKLFSDERINVYFAMDNDENIVMGLITSNSKFSSLTSGELEDPSLNIYVAEDVVSEMDNSENPGDVLQSALKDGRIRYEAIGFFNKVKFAAVNLMVKVGKWFSEETSEETKAEEVVEVQTETDVEELDEQETQESETETEELTEKPIQEDLSNEEEVEEVEEEIKTHIVEMNNNGFSQNGTLTIKVGEAIEWKNVRTGSLKKAMVIGTQSCSQVKSKFFDPGESFSWTFEEALTCTVVGGVYTTETMKLKVE